MKPKKEKKLIDCEKCGREVWHNKTKLSNGQRSFQCQSCQRRWVE